jgi:iron complex transport system ATP-binding protein
LSALAADSGTPPLVLVTHHVEELPAGITHVGLVRGGRLVSAGAVDDVLTTEAVSACFGVPVTVHRAEGRWTARATVGDTPGA